MSLSALETTTGLDAPRSPDAQVLLLGLGNDILTDDAVGLLVVRQLQGALADCPAIDVRETKEMGLALLDFIAGYSVVVIVDSIQTGKAPPATVHELDAGALRQLTGRTPHFLGVSETLALGRHLGLAMPAQVRIFAIEVEDPFTLGTSLTPVLQAALPRIAERIAAAVRSLV
ncbi:MAG TPA: hydrogenase maturation protease [Candidatus Paceibacterota bacterium]|nr:hydrogenase maturation protease [Verrucomicrobiota bacterium]HSA11690.1 hydrogenase maturation protease [Candidatus Paceibacterota bacterium]